ncbi:MAG: hypothetical protein V8S12_03610 [Lachnospiraceae bacterium]
MMNRNIAIAVRIVNGYASSNAASVAKDIINYRYNLKDKSEIITGTATQGNCWPFQRGLKLQKKPFEEAAMNPTSVMIKSNQYGLIVILDAKASI